MLLQIWFIKARFNIFSGGLFHSTDSNQEIAFRYAVEKINGNRDILPKSRLSAQIEQISPQDSFHASKRGNYLCNRNIKWDCLTLDLSIKLKTNLTFLIRKGDGDWTKINS